jgi:hypothetical protein
MASGAVAVVAIAATMRLPPPRHHLRFNRPSLPRLRLLLQRRDKAEMTSAVASVAAVAIGETTRRLLPRHHLLSNRPSLLRLRLLLQRRDKAKMTNAVASVAAAASVLERTDHRLSAQPRRRRSRTSQN